MRGKLSNTKKVNKKLAWTIMGLFFAILLYIPIHLARATNYEDPTRVENSIRILEIEPGNQFMINNGFSSNLIGDCDLITDKSIAGGYTRDVKITHVTMPEFISQVDQINGKYDIVVIGRQNNGLRVTFEGTNNNIYRDYSNPFSEKPGYIPENWTNNGNWPMRNGETRWGNTYVESYSENDITDKRAKEILSLIDSKQAVFIDNNIFSSDLNNTKLVKNFASKSNCKINHGDITLDNILTKYVSSSANYNKRLKLQITKEPASDDASQRYGVKTNRDLSIDYSITNATGNSQDIEVNLYMDLNGDSMYLNKEGMACDTNNTTVAAGATINGTLKYNVADEFLGYLEWKVEIVNKSTGVKRYKTGKVIYRQLKEQEGKTIRVLQITCPPGNTNTRYGDWEDCNNNISLANDTRIKDLLKDNNLDGYNVKIDQQTIDQFGTNVQTFIDQNKTVNENLSEQEKKRYLNGKYDMLIIGFADAFGLNSSGNHEFTEAAITEIKYFIQTGQSVMFTHDTIPIVVNSQSSQFLGSKKLAQAFRDCIGQARYKDEYNNSQKDIYKETVIDDNNITYEDKTIQHDQLPNTSNVSYGYTDSILIQADSNGWNYNNKQPYVTTPRDATNYNSKITKINSGVINEFPFVLGDISTAKTHTQWFQLNLEDEDVVPWYTINGDNQNQAWRNKVIDKYDARNNYYTYSKGNITYSGTGHRNNFTDDELKLFINTIVKADRGANHAPNIVCSIPREKLDENDYTTNDASIGMDYNFNVNANDIEKDIVKMHMTIDGNEVTNDNVDLSKLNSKKEFIVDTGNIKRSALSVRIPATKLAHIDDSVTVKIEAEDIQGAKSIKNYVLKAVELPSFVIKAELDKDQSGNSKLIKVDVQGNIITDGNGQAIASTVIGNEIEVQKNENVRVPYKVSSEEFSYGDRYNYPQKELVLLIDTSIEPAVWTDVKNGIQNNIINKLVGANEDVKINIITYGGNVQKMMSKGGNDYRNDLQLQLQEAEHYINNISTTSNLKAAIEEGIDCFRANDLPYSGKNFIIISGKDPTDMENIEELSSTIKENYNVITVDINQGYNVTNPHLKLKQVHSILGGLACDYFIDKPSEPGQTAHNNMGQTMNRVANSTGHMKYKTYLLNNIKLNFNLGSEIDSVSGLIKKEGDESIDNKYYKDCPKIKYVPKVDSSGNVVYNGNKVCYEWYLMGENSDESDLTYETNFIIKAKSDAVGECKFELPNEVTYEYAENGIQGKRNIDETPILKLNTAKVYHGIYKKIEDGKAIVDNTDILGFAKDSLVTFGANISGMDSAGDIAITIDSKAQISEKPKLYSIDSNGNLDLIAVMDSNNEDGTNTFRVNNFNGANYNNIVVLYSIKLSDTEEREASYENKVIVNGIAYKAAVNSISTENKNRELPDLF